MKIIFGLGNPGAKYALNYHNLGFMVIDVLAERSGITAFRKENDGLSATVFFGGEKTLLVKPLTFMNASGECVRKFVDYYGVSLSDVLVIYDDIDVDKGRLRFRTHGSSGTHNGMRSIVSCLKSEDFPRLRVGSKNTNPEIPLIDYVLMNIPQDERTLMSAAVKKAADFVADFASGTSFDRLSCLYNGN